jgi:hemerythrin-like domain-containing protein
MGEKMDKAMEGLREVATGSTPENDLRARLHSDHAEVARLIEALLATDEIDVSTREELKTQIIVQLTAHAKAEEEVVYATLELNGHLRAQADVAYREHEEIEDLLRDLETLDGGDGALSAVARTLQQAVTHHVHEEETSVLPNAERELGQPALAALIPRFNQRRTELMRSMLDQFAGTGPGYSRPNRLSESDSRF